MLTWRAYYSDGAMATERTDKYQSLDRSRLVGFELIDEKGEIATTFRIRPGCVLFYRHRDHISLEGGVVSRTHLLGWRRRGLDGEVKTVLLTVNGKGEVERRSGFGGEWWEPQWMSEEQV